MKRSNMITLIANLLDVVNENFKDYKVQLTAEELSKADTILTSLEQTGMQPPKVKVEEVRKSISPEGEDGMFISWTYKSIWEPEDENK